MYAVMLIFVFIMSLAINFGERLIHGESDAVQQGDSDEQLLTANQVPEEAQ